MRAVGSKIQEFEKEDSSISKNDNLETSVDKDDVESLNIYELSYPSEKGLEDFEREDFIRFIYNNYLNNENLEEDKLNKDLIVLKTYHDEIEYKINHRYDYSILFETLIKMLNLVRKLVLTFLTFDFGIDFVKIIAASEIQEANMALKDLFTEILKTKIYFINILVGILICTILTYTLSFIFKRRDISKKEDDIENLISVKNAIYKLETLKEEMERKDNK